MDEALSKGQIQAHGECPAKHGAPAALWASVWRRQTLRSEIADGARPG
ncbi:hypothetical protein [Cupriavidus pinatubonensis]|nr:hypothetical protein [Cupriavidus pinatubonensis]